MFRHSATTISFLPIRRRIFPSSSFRSQAQIDVLDNGISSSGSSETITIIRPSSPTPPHLAEFKLSLIDTNIRPFYMPFIFFYPATGSSSSKPGGNRALDILKSSLPKALARFYPLAGRLSRSESDSIPIVRCHDEGVPFSAAEYPSMSMTLFLRNQPQLDSLHQFLPFPSFLIRTPSLVESAPQIAFKATVFPCGGVAVGACLLHKIVDAHTFFDFMKLWAAVARGSEKGGGSYAHDRAATSLFPARPDDVGPSNVEYDCSKDEEEVQRSVTRRFVFDEEAISALKARARTGWVPNPTRSESIFGLLWKAADNAAATALAPDGVKKAGSVYSVAGPVVNLRPRMEKPWPDYSVGNIILYSFAAYQQEVLQSPNETKALQQAVHNLRSSITKVDKKFMRKVEGGGGREEYMRNEEMRSKVLASGAQSGSKVMYIVMTSVVGMRPYDNVDFGWGKPAWISLTQLPDDLNNSFTLVNTPNGNGVEAWVAMDRQDMAILERDPEILAYAKSNPSIL